MSVGPPLDRRDVPDEAGGAGRPCFFRRVDRPIREGNPWTIPVHLNTGRLWNRNPK